MTIGIAAMIFGAVMLSIMNVLAKRKREPPRLLGWAIIPFVVAISVYLAVHGGCTPERFDF